MMLKEMTRDADQAEKLPDCKWRNLLFDKKGNSYRGSHVHNTAPEAAARMRDCEALNASGANSGYRTMDGVIKKDDYAWAMQLPVVEGQ